MAKKNDQRQKLSDRYFNANLDLWLITKSLIPGIFVQTSESESLNVEKEREAKEEKDGELDNRA